MWYGLGMAKPRRVRGRRNPRVVRGALYREIGVVFRGLGLRPEIGAVVAAVAEFDEPVAVDDLAVLTDLSPAVVARAAHAATELDLLVLSRTAVGGARYAFDRELFWRALFTHQLRGVIAAKGVFRAHLPRALPPPGVLTLPE